MKTRNTNPGLAGKEISRRDFVAGAAAAAAFTIVPRRVLGGRGRNNNIFRNSFGDRRKFRRNSVSKYGKQCAYDPDPGISYNEHNGNT